MALIDVSDLLLDPDFTSPLTLIRRAAGVNQYGENVVIDNSTLVTIGSVQPVSGKDLIRVPDAYKQSDVRTFYIKAPLITTGSSLYPDIILYGAKRFQIIQVSDWLNYGQGWNSGICVAEVPS